MPSTEKPESVYPRAARPSQAAPRTPEASPCSAGSSRVDDEWVADMDKRGFKGAALLKSAKDLIAKYGTRT